MDVSEILPKLFVGSFPDNADDITQLKAVGVTAVLSLQTQEDFDYLGVDWPEMRSLYCAHRIEVRRVPITDFDDNDLRDKLPAAVRVLAELMDEGHVCYVHCNVGVNRSPSVVISYLHWSPGWSLEDAEGHVRKCRSCSPEMEAIRLATRDRQRPFA